MIRIVAMLIAVAACAPAQEMLSGQSAYDLTKEVVAFGPRPSGSAAAKKMQAHIVAKLKSWGWAVEEDAWVAQTPVGRVAMKNIIAKKPGASANARILAVSGHIDTKRFPFPFVGANDAGASTGLLLELARVLRNASFKHEVRLVFFDGEEAMKDWTDEDSLYGSRRTAARWQKDGTLARVDALINLDMIGDRDLRIVREQYSSEPLMRLIWQVAGELGYSRHFGNDAYPIADDHVPFLRLGVRAADLIDFNYGPDNGWWHTQQDTMDKLSPKSFEAVGRVVAETLRRLD